MGTFLRCWQKQVFGKREPHFIPLSSPGTPTAASQPRPECGMQTDGKGQGGWPGSLEVTDFLPVVQTADRPMGSSANCSATWWRASGSLGWGTLGKPKTEEQHRMSPGREAENTSFSLYSRNDCKQKPQDSGAMKAKHQNIQSQKC